MALRKFLILRRPQCGRLEGRTALIQSVVAVLLLLGAAKPRAEDTPTRADIWSLKLGTPVSALPRDAFVDYACGSNGGPPQQALTGWSDYDECSPEPNGLHEVYFRYDDELEYWAKAHRARTLIAQYSSTKVLDFPVILSGAVRHGRNARRPAYRHRSAGEPAGPQAGLHLVQFF
jgi:hypothetical protein